MLLGNKAQPSGYLTPVVKAPGVTNLGHQSASRDRTNTRNLCQLAADATLAVPLDDLLLEFVNLTV